MQIYVTSHERYPRIIVEGVVSLDDIKDAVSDALSGPSFTESTGTIVDISASSSDRTHQEVRQLAVFLGEHRAQLGSRLAFVVSDSLHYGLVRMFSAYAEFQHLIVEVCSTLDEAIQWMGLSDDEARARRAQRLQHIEPMFSSDPPGRPQQSHDQEAD